MERVFVFFVLLISASLFIFLLSVALDAMQQYHSNQTPDPDHGNNSPNPHTSDSDQNRQVAAAIDAYRHQRDTHERERTQREHTATIVLSLTGAFALLAAIAAFVSAWIFFGQLQEMKTAGEETKKAVDAAIQLSNESKRQADLAQQNLILARRPWVDFVDRPQLDEPLTFHDNGAVSISVKTSARNVGNSPAVNVTFFSKLHLGEWPSGNIDDIIKKHICMPEKTNFFGAPFSTIIVPNSREELWPSKDVSNKVNKNQPQPIHAWVSICLQYEDEFGIPHATGQIFIHLPEGGRPMPASPSGPIPGTLKAHTGKIMK